MTFKPINPGKYRHQIVIKNPATDSSRDSTGARTGSGTTLATVWAEKQDWSGSETRDTNQETAVKLTKFLIRYLVTVAPKMQVVHGSDTYDIEQVLDMDGTKREMVLHCRKVM